MLYFIFLLFLLCLVLRFAEEASTWTYLDYGIKKFLVFVFTEHAADTHRETKIQIQTVSFSHMQMWYFWYWIASIQKLFLSCKQKTTKISKVLWYHHALARKKKNTYTQMAINIHIQIWMEMGEKRFRCWKCDKCKIIWHAKLPVFRSF